ncbi:hypothetical protein DE146DRAFT_741247 [Phaeosphaeria sp. MPI-PUGE-AT-0046c]|nr:hypothetical protein DE146DRAFT_741247 [Phaeosphaeria sp. MPI-PUGE-AT-0046c]
MERLELPVRRDDEEVEKVMGWLEELEMVEEAEEEEKEREAEPFTPQRRSCTNEEQVSPTNTSFSETSLFDQPCPARREESNDDDNTSVTSISPSANSTCRTDKLQLERTLPPTSQASLAKTLPAVLANDPNPPPSLADTHICLLPCLSCTSLSLPCSLTLPICSRCKRNKNTCVFLRHRVTEEIDAANMETCTLPVLFRQQEGEEEWQGKVEAARRVMDEMERRGERENWVLPRWW